MTSTSIKALNTPSNSPTPPCTPYDSMVNTMAPEIADDMPDTATLIKPVAVMFHPPILRYNRQTKKGDNRPSRMAELKLQHLKEKKQELEEEQRAYDVHVNYHQLPNKGKAPVHKPPAPPIPNARLPLDARTNRWSLP
ncbi:uncharacterized protein ARMOST_22530 [Armillaria ostoyae]|uniref:Uncharacterized protein n=1 Tax=Armillaria ostoyae TaxID=47428 RepID=A0A284SD45_ARMOS|nr:uncharacterized protein ARMOST_22530 [Armillaria ostoyae]